MEERIEELEWEVSTLVHILEKLKVLYPPKYTHECWEWDGLEIDEYCAEFLCCTCFQENKQ